MEIDYDMPSVERLKFFIEARGMTARQLSKLVWDDKTHRDVIDELTKKPNVRAKTLVKICRILKVPIDCLFQKSDKERDFQIIDGNNSNVKSSYNDIEIITLKAENNALKMIIQEKDSRIEDLKKFNMDLLAHINATDKVGQNSDNKI